MRARIPDPCDEQTFLTSKLDWEWIDHAPAGLEFRALTRQLLTIRRENIVPLNKQGFVSARSESFRANHCTGGLDVRWQTANGHTLQIVANFSDRDLPMPPMIPGRALWTSRSALADVLLPNDIIVRLGQES